MSTLVDALLAGLVSGQAKKVPDCGDGDCPIHGESGLLSFLAEDDESKQDSPGKWQDMNSIMALDLAIDAASSSQYAFGNGDSNTAVMFQRQADQWTRIHDRLQALEQNAYFTSGMVDRGVRHGSEMPPPFADYVQHLKDKADNPGSANDAESVTSDAPVTE